MSISPPSFLGIRQRRALTASLVAWAVVWVLVGLVASVQIWQLTRVSSALTSSGEALQTAGEGLESLGRVPLVGEGARQLGQETQEAAGEIQASGSSTRSNIQVLSVVVGLSIGLIPLTALIGFSAPLGLVARQERRTIRRMLREVGEDPAFEAFLAYRAVQRLPYETLLEVTAEPWQDLQAGRYRRLANAELTRLGLATRPGR